MRVAGAGGWCSRGMRAPAAATAAPTAAATTAAPGMRALSCCCSWAWLGQGLFVAQALRRPRLACAAHRPAARSNTSPAPPHPTPLLPQVAFVGFAVQALVTRTGPIEGLTKHLADPFGKNITYFVTHSPEVLAGTA